MGEGVPKPTPEEIEKADEQQSVRQRVMGEIRAEKLGELSPKDISTLKNIDGFYDGDSCTTFYFKDGHELTIRQKEDGSYSLEVDSIAMIGEDYAKKMFEKMMHLRDCLIYEAAPYGFYGTDADKRISQDPNLKQKADEDRRLVREKEIERHEFLMSILDY